MRRAGSISRSVALTVLLIGVGASEVLAQARTRAEEIELRRRDKQARLWPERESPIVTRANNLLERGLISGAESGKGANGFQIAMGGMRSGQGFTVGVGYRRSDIWRDRIGFRTTARATPQLATLLDFQLDFHQLRTDWTFVNFYAKYENSPQMDYYGQRSGSSLDNRSSYRLEDFGTDFQFGVNFSGFRIGATFGTLYVHTGPGDRSGVPSVEDVFPPPLIPGFGEDTSFARWGFFVDYDWRDLRSGSRSGGYYAVRLRSYEDVDLEKYGYGQIEGEVQQFIPYFNRSHTLAFRVSAVFTFEDAGQNIPFYLQPKLGGNDDLRGFARYRFYDDSAIIASVEHRWQAAKFMDVALFVDAGKVQPDAEQESKLSRMWKEPTAR